MQVPTNVIVVIHSLTEAVTTTSHPRLDVERFVKHERSLGRVAHSAAASPRCAICAAVNRTKEDQP